MMAPGSSLGNLLICQASTLEKRTQSTRNRYRTLLHAMLSRAKRHGRLAANPVQGVPRFKEPEGRTLYLMPEDKAPEEAAIRDALRFDLRPLFHRQHSHGLPVV
jgi:hypothetical protein